MSIPPSVANAIGKNVVKQAAFNLATSAISGAKKATKSSRNRRRQRRRRRNAMVGGRYRFRRNRAPVSFANSFGGIQEPVTITQMEYIGDIYTVGPTKKWPWQKGNSTQEFTIDSFPLNPANPATFPWLSNIAKLFDKYKFLNLEFTYTNQVSTISNGRVAMGIDFDTLDKEPQNMMAVSQLSKFETFAPFTTRTFTVPVGKTDWLYTYDESSKKNDLKTYNLGTFFVANKDCAENNTEYSRCLGSISVKYTVQLKDKSYVSPTARVSTLPGVNAYTMAGTFEYTTGTTPSSFATQYPISGNLAGRQNEAQTQYEIYTTQDIPAGMNVGIVIKVYGPQNMSDSYTIANLATDYTWSEINRINTSTARSYYGLLNLPDGANVNDVLFRFTKTAGYSVDFIGVVGQ